MEMITDAFLQNDWILPKIHIEVWNIYIFSSFSLFENKTVNQFVLKAFRIDKQRKIKM